MKALAALLACLAILVAVVPYFNNCQHDGVMMALANGRQAPMRCYWTACAEIALALPLLGVAIGLGIARRRESLLILSALAAALGASVTLLPTTLIGTCAAPDASCNLVMKPALLAMGALVAGVGVAGLAFAARRPELTAARSADGTS